MSADRIRLDGDRYEVTYVVAVTPTRRDVWAILRGRYEPKVQTTGVPTQAGIDRAWRGP